MITKTAPVFAVVISIVLAGFVYYVCIEALTRKNTFSVAGWAWHVSSVIEFPEYGTQAKISK